MAFVASCRKERYRMAIVSGAPTQPTPGPQKSKEIFYPIEDGEPMAESDLHLLQMFYCLFALRTYYAGQPDVYVASGNFLYYVRATPERRSRRTVTWYSVWVMNCATCTKYGKRDGKPLPWSLRLPPSPRRKRT